MAILASTGWKSKGNKRLYTLEYTLEGKLYMSDGKQTFKSTMWGKTAEETEGGFCTLYVHTWLSRSLLNIGIAR